MDLESGKYQPQSIAFTQKTHSVTSYVYFPYILALISLISVLIHFQKPQKIFQSAFIISLLTLFIKSCKGSCFDFGYPKGALGMAAAGMSPYLYPCASTDSDCPPRSSARF
jgi:hypothetical protein